jgi:hypothetical protein
MLKSIEDVESLADKAYEAALNPANWAQFLRDFAEGVGASSAATLWFDGRNSQFIRAEVANIDPTALQEYAEHYVKSCPRWLVGTMCTAGQIYDDRQAQCSTSSYTKEYYNWAGRYGIDQLLGLNAERNREFGVGFLVYKPGNTEFGTFERRVLSHLAPHLRRAAGVSMKLSQIEASANVYGAIFELVNCAAFLLNHSGEVIEINARGEALLRSTNLIRLRQKRLEFPSN